MNGKKKAAAKDALQDMTDRIKDQQRERKRNALLADKQLMLWSEEARGIPNEIVRSALFTVRNRNQPREQLKDVLVAGIGEGQITYTGEELRQDDETVWLQLIHLSRLNGLHTAFYFTPSDFCKAIRWPVSGQSYNRLDKCLTRLQVTSLKLYSKRIDQLLSFAMLPFYSGKRRTTGNGGLWSAKMHEELVFLFSDFYYTRIEWQQRLSLPDGMATWLHAYYTSHKDPYNVRIETLAKGSGLIPAIDINESIAEQKGRLREAKKVIVRALKLLKEATFLEEFEVTRDGLVRVCRSKNDKTDI